MSLPVDFFICAPVPSTVTTLPADLRTSVAEQGWSAASHAPLERATPGSLPGTGSSVWSAQRMTAEKTAWSKATAADFVLLRRHKHSLVPLKMAGQQGEMTVAHFLSTPRSEAEVVNLAKSLHAHDFDRIMDTMHRMLDAWIEYRKAARPEAVEKLWKIIHIVYIAGPGHRIYEFLGKNMFSRGQNYMREALEILSAEFSHKGFSRDVKEILDNALSKWEATKHSVEETGLRAKHLKGKADPNCTFSPYQCLRLCTQVQPLTTTQIKTLRSEITDVLRSTSGLFVKASYLSMALTACPQLYTTATDKTELMSALVDFEWITWAMRKADGVQSSDPHHIDMAAPPAFPISGAAVAIASTQEKCVGRKRQTPSEGGLETESLKDRNLSSHNQSIMPIERLIKRARTGEPMRPMPTRPTFLTLGNEQFKVDTLPMLPLISEGITQTVAVDGRKFSNKGLHKRDSQTTIHNTLNTIRKTDTLKLLNSWISKTQPKTSISFAQLDLADSCESALQPGYSSEELDIMLAEVADLPNMAL